MIFNNAKLSGWRQLCGEAEMSSEHHYESHKSFQAWKNSSGSVLLPKKENQIIKNLSLLFRYERTTSSTKVCAN